MTVKKINQPKVTEIHLLKTQREQKHALNIVDSFEKLQSPKYIDRVQIALENRASIQLLNCPFPAIEKKNAKT